MSDGTGRIGGSTTNSAAAYSGVTQTAEGAAARASQSARNNSQSGTPGAGRGRVERVVSSSQSPDQLDRSAPRGTYLNILA